MQILNIHEAKTHLSRLIEDAMNGKETIIAKAGKPIAKLSPVASKKPSRHFGVLKGKIKISKDFDAPLPPEILTDFEN